MIQTDLIRDRTGWGMIYSFIIPELGGKFVQQKEMTVSYSTAEHVIITRCRIKIRMTILKAIGKVVERIEPAAINRQLELNIPCRLLTPTGKVYIASLVKTILGHKNSPQEPINVKIARTAKDGFTIGINTLKNT